MMKSLWSGVSGLQAHQVAMDVESNNIANVNTTGFKYSRANFADMLSQTYKPATSPQGDLGGSNDMQVGLGTTVNSTTRIYSQGSVQNTDSTTDMAIQGDGFFIVSADAGKTYTYTRSGGFNFDSYGNLVDNNGLVVQGWTRKIQSDGESCSGSDTTTVDSTQPIANIKIESGLKIPAKVTSYMSLKANLDNGSTVETKSCIRALDSAAGVKTAAGISTRYKDSNGKILDRDEEDFGILFNANGEAFNLQSIDSLGQNGQGFVFTVQTSSVSVYTYTFRYTDEKTTKGHPQASDSATSISAGSSTTTNGITTTTMSTPLYFRTTEDLRKMLQLIVKDPNNDGVTTDGYANATVTVDQTGRFSVSNTDSSKNLTLGVKELTDSTTSTNTLFTQAFQSLDGIILANNSRTSQTINAATHAASTDIYDSFGTKHTLRLEFRKTGVNEWSFTASVPEPSELVGQDTLSKQLEGGVVRFNSDGSLSSYSPPTLTFEPNNGSKGGQIVQLKFGTMNAFDGVTSLDKTSTTEGISQDGYAGGDLVSKRIDTTGTIIGTFSNGRSLALAQVAMAKFTNPAGLSSNGSNLFSQTANSGEPVIGTAGTGGRGTIQSSALEMSNVDLSRSLTELIVIQRGYQANSKTITTSDQMLNTLLQLKQ